MSPRKKHSESGNFATLSFLPEQKRNSSHQTKECGMLVLTRKQSEKIQIGENITITVVRMKGKAVRLGIEAPTNVNVLRGELIFDADTFEGDTDAADIHSGEPAAEKDDDQAATDTVVEFRVPRAQHSQFVI